MTTTDKVIYYLWAFALGLLGCAPMVPPVHEALVVHGHPVYLVAALLVVALVRQ